MAEDREGLRSRSSINERQGLSGGPESSGIQNGNTIGNTWSDWANFQANYYQTEDGEPLYRTRQEYQLALQQWMCQYRCWSNMQMFYATFPAYMMSCMQMQNFQQQLPGQPTMNGTVPTQPPFPRQAQGQAHAPPRPGARAAMPADQQIRRIEYRIPTLWKRVLAEFIDFMILFLVKLAVTIVAVEYMGITDLDKYDIEKLFSQNLDYNTAFAMTSELVALEIINRIFICLFEVLCLRKGIGQIGGATPGKRVLGLRVVSCAEIIELPDQRVLVTPAGDIGTWNATVRSVIKNFSLAFFFPACFTVFFYQHNRAAYDIVANSVVVEPVHAGRIIQIRIR